jgi:hypothetical protein
MRVKTAFVQYLGHQVFNNKAVVNVLMAADFFDYFMDYLSEFMQNFELTSFKNVMKNKFIKNKRLSVKPDVKLEF